MTTAHRFFLVIPAAGVGRRMQSQIPKQYLPLAGKPLLVHTLERLLSLPIWHRVMLALNAEDPYWPGLSVQWPPHLQRVEGGVERMDSVLNALQALQPLAAADDWVLVHDAARPLIQPQVVQDLIQQLQADAVGGLLAVPLADTLKRADADGRVAKTLDRQQLWRAQTPQMFRYGLLCRALQQAQRAGMAITDEASAIEYLGLSPRLVPGPAENFKITLPEDWALAERLLQAG